MIGSALALSAGMVTAFNPCGVALLPAYLAFLLAGRQHNRRSSWKEGLSAGIMMTLGFVLLFGTAGLVVGVLGKLLYVLAPVMSVLLAALLLVFAWQLWMGKTSGVSRLGLIGQWVSSLVHQGSPWAFFVYGVSYGVASLTCSLPVFLAVAATGFARGTMTGIVLFVAFSLGMGLVVTVLSIIAAEAGELSQKVIRSVIPMVNKLSAVVMVLASGYLVWYWFIGPGLNTGLT